MSLGIVWYAWAKRPEIIPSKMALVLETQVRPRLQRVAPLRAYLPPVIGGDDGEEADANASGRQDSTGDPGDASKGKDSAPESALAEAKDKDGDAEGGQEEVPGGEEQKPTEGVSPAEKPSEAAAVAEASAQKDDVAAHPTPSTPSGSSAGKSTGSQAKAVATGHGRSDAPAAEPSHAASPSPAPDSAKPAATATAPKPVTKPKPAAPKAEPAPKPKRCVKGKPATLRILAKPVWGTVFVDGDEWGATPTTREITSGNHELKVKRGGYKDVVETVCVNPGKEPTIVTVQMEKP